MGSKRTYSGSALEQWFRRLSTDWERQFREPDLAQGRALYRQGVVRSVELSATDAIVHGLVAGQSAYAVVDWPKSTAMIRGSLGDDRQSKPLAIAGIYEIEELVADEIPQRALPEKPGDEAWLDGDDPDEAESADGSRTGETGHNLGPALRGHEATTLAPLPRLRELPDGRVVVGRNGFPSGRRLPNPAPTRTPGETLPNGHRRTGLDDGSPTTTAQPVPPPARRIFITFRWREDEVSFSAYWQSGGRRTLVFGPKADPSTGPERIGLITLATSARRAGFRPDGQGRYRLDDLERLPRFLRQVLPLWQERHEVELPAQWEATQATPVDLEVSVRALTEEHLPGSFSLQWQAHGDGLALSTEEIPALLRRGGGLRLTRQGRLVSVSRQVADSFEFWRELAAGRDHYPRYLLFSLMGRAELPAHLAPQLAAWRREVETARTAGAAPASEATRNSEIAAAPETARELAATDGTAGMPPAKNRQPTSRGHNSQPPEEHASAPAARVAEDANPTEDANSVLNLRDYQRTGVAWMEQLAQAGCHGLLADEMGLGKTVQVLSWIAQEPLDDRPSLIVCPASVVPVWQREVARFFPELTTEVLRSDHTPGRLNIGPTGFSVSGDNGNLQRSPATTPDGESATPAPLRGRPASRQARPTLWLASYSQLRRQRAAFDGLRLGYLILDEAQSIKNPDAKVTQACLSLHAERRLAVTGTPVENRPLDLWTLFRFLMPGLLGSRRRFELHWLANEPEARRLLRQQTAPFILRRTKAAVLPELPEKIESELLCPLTEVQGNEYRRLTKEGIAELGNTWQQAEARMPLLALLTRLRQACCDPGLLPWMQCPPEQSGKLALLADRLAEITANGHKAVVFSQFTALLERAEALLHQRLPEVPRWSLTGTTKDRSKPVQAFQRAVGPALFLASLKAGGTGITLHAADYVFLLDPWWNPAVERQAIDRVHRIGQKRAVFIYRMVTVGTIEARIEALKQRKAALSDDLLAEDSSTLPRLADWYHSLEALIAPEETNP